MATEREPLFTNKKTAQQAKTAATDNAARLIVAAETAAREKKTAKLRALRLQQQPEHDAEPASPPKRTRKK